MPSAALYIGGGLLEGVGKGIAGQGIENGKEKRQRALAQFKSDLDKDLLDKRLKAEEKRPKSAPGQVASDIAGGLLPKDFPLLSTGTDGRPSTVKEAQFLMDKGIAPNWNDAWKMASEGSYSPQKIYSSAWTKIYNETLASTFNEDTAKSAADSGALTLMKQMETMFGPGGTGATGAPSPPPKTPKKKTGLLDSVKDFMTPAPETSVAQSSAVPSGPRSQARPAPPPVAKPGPAAPGTLGGTLPAPAQTYVEGQTATNPKTGQRMIFKGGQWRPL